MAWQSSLEQAKSIRLGRNTVIGLVTGILVGLLLGLLIGWVWWPVEWQGADTTAAPAQAARQFASSEGNAQYLGAVADAYVYASAAGEPAAASVAAQRLATLGGDMRAAFDNALTYYSTEAGGATQVNNLNMLALAVGIPLASAGAAELQPSDQVAAAATTTSIQSGVTTVAVDDNGGSLNWLLILLFALLLIGGGLYILLTLRRRQALTDTGETGFEEEEITSTVVSTSAFDRNTLTPVRSGLSPAASIRSSVERPQTSGAGGAHGFDSEEIDEYGDAEYDEAAAAEETATVQTRYYSGAGAYAPADDSEDDEFSDDQSSGEQVGGEHFGDEQFDDVQPGRHGPSTGFVTSVGATPPFSGPQSSSRELRQPPAADERSAASTPSMPAVPVRNPPPATLQPPTPSRFERYAPVDSYTATYFVGRVDFDKTNNVLNADGDSYIGEYGIGIHEKRGYLNNDMEKAIVIDVYLFDKTDERHPVSISRSLLSVYAYDHRRAEYERDRENQSLPPIVAQPNTKFQLEGRELLLDCLIKQVDYTSEGVFQNVTVEMVLKRRN